ncbi:FAD dependent oxidoreductase [Paenibacillus sp. UNCCL117]|uniref:FAD-dependent oxidoreductase n=2 Tax=unclassified Paenibacillus TaxID=185978 RepID=UPI0008900545|nr:FAD-dependent oxidoreductase [Paenibacillus sp. UNCCL117]SDE25551.1 FAD dependent oxidoreductase [Paenibacillus sp. cl123]SFW62443.1 FAD dependent oxidoreductase [Paenibacillus sp. UNCCL117]
MESRSYEYDVIVYGGNAAGIMAGVQAVRMGLRTIVLEPGVRLGGLTTGGLGATDAGDPAAIGGLSQEFYERLARAYGRPGLVWRFEPKAALNVLEDIMAEYGLTAVTKARLLEHGGVDKQDNRIRSITLESGEVYSGKVFIDATYEGDLMARAGVAYIVGREGNEVYGEANNGIRRLAKLEPRIDPYRVPGDPQSGLLARVNPNPGGKPGDGDGKTQAYNYRMCLTDDPDNRLPIEKPADYREEDYEILFRLLEQGYTGPFFKLTMMPNRKTDSNNTGMFSTDYIGMSHAFAEAGYAQREELMKRHETYQKGLVWTLQHHPRVPEAIRSQYAPWGLPRDEFAESGHWPSQLYVRESRRMLGERVVTEHTVNGSEFVGDPVGLGSYAMDSHYTQYCLDEEGDVCVEGGFFVSVQAPFAISYKAIVPKRSECGNLLVPICLSSTHAAYGSIRMEPVFMVLGQSAGAAAALAAASGGAVQDVDYTELRSILDRDGQILDLGEGYVTPPGTTGNPL